MDKKIMLIYLVFLLFLIPFSFATDCTGWDSYSGDLNTDILKQLPADCLNVVIKNNPKSINLNELTKSKLSGKQIGTALAKCGTPECKQKYNTFLLDYPDRAKDVPAKQVAEVLGPDLSKNDASGTNAANAMTNYWNKKYPGTNLKFQPGTTITNLNENGKNVEFQTEKPLGNGKFEVTTTKITLNDDGKWKTSITPDGANIANENIEQDITGTTNIGSDEEGNINIDSATKTTIDNTQTGNTITGTDITNQKTKETQTGISTSMEHADELTLTTPQGKNAKLIGANNAKITTSQTQTGSQTELTADTSDSTETKTGIFGFLKNIVHKVFKTEKDVDEDGTMETYITEELSYQATRQEEQPINDPLKEHDITIYHDEDKDYKIEQTSSSTKITLPENSVVVAESDDHVITFNETIENSTIGFYPGYITITNGTIQFEYKHHTEQITAEHARIYYTEAEGLTA